MAAFDPQPGVTAATYADTSVTNGTTYFYTVSAVNAAGESPLSAEVSATPQVAAPAAPTNLGATAVSISQINLTWVDNSSNETGFVIERQVSGTGNWVVVGTVGANVNWYNDYTAQWGVWYQYRVAAVNGSVQSPYVNSNTALTIS